MNRNSAVWLRRFVQAQNSNMSLGKCPRQDLRAILQRKNAADLASILSLAMDAESAERARYKGLAEAATDAAAKALFRRLALEEEIHHRIVSDAFYAISNRGVWVWAE
jgi:rubrerythrin